MAQRLTRNAVTLWMASKSLVLIQALVWRKASTAVVLKLASVVVVLPRVLVQTVRLTVVLRMVDQAMKTVLLRLY